MPNNCRKQINFGRLTCFKMKIQINIQKYKKNILIRNYETNAIFLQKLITHSLVHYLLKQRKFNNSK